MTKSTGRGRGWRRKGSWEQLAQSTQKRYQSAGINRARYERGASRTDYDRFLRDQERYYGRDRDDVKEELRGFDRGAIIDAANLQREMQRLFDAGDVESARRLWETRDENMPAWMFFYHGAFS